MTFNFNKLFWIGVWIMISSAIVILASIFFNIFISVKIGEVFIQTALIICTIGFILLPLGLFSKTNPIWEPFWNVDVQSEERE